MGLYTKMIDIQKLRDAWAKVKRNKPAAGADEVTYEMFDRNANEEIKQLHIELNEHRYHSFPVKLVKIQREEKLREVSLYVMRDKVVQASVASELSAMFEKRFSDCAYAYRNSLSAMIAIERIEEDVRKKNCNFVCKTDIKSFFDSISLEVLNNKLNYAIHEADVVDLIMTILHAPSVDGDGDLTEKQRGIYQGSGISPVLSNIYLTEFDKEMEKAPVRYYRYADDIVILADTKEVIDTSFAKMKLLLGELQLRINEEKTLIGSVEDGFDFLGYHFSKAGKAIPKKATEKLQCSLEDVWVTMVGTSLEERLVKGAQILQGWEQYYRGERPIQNIYEYVVLVYMLRYKNELWDLAKQRTNYKNTFRDIAAFLLEVWKENDRRQLSLLEYEQYYNLDETPTVIKENYYLDEMLGIYSRLWKSETEEEWLNLMQVYSDQEMYDKSERIMQRIEEHRSSEAEGTSPVIEPTESDGKISFDASTLEYFEQYLRGREDMYSREIMTGDRRKCEYVPEPLTKDIIRKHLDGSETIGTYVVRNNDTVHYIVFDIDISRKVLLKPEEYEFDRCLQEAAQFTRKLSALIQNMGLRSYIEFSGYRGYHLWIFLSEWIPTRYAYALLDVITMKMDELPPTLTVETFPSRTKRKIGSSGANLKLPYGVHLYSGKRSYYVQEDFTPIMNCNRFFSMIATFSAENVKRVIGANNTTEMNKKSQQTVEIQLDMDKLGELSDSILVVLNGCSLMKYLVHKSVSTGYLSHTERLAVLNVFGHVGDSGKEFVHTVMSFTMNYQYNTTQKFINRLPEKPISCVKLRDQYKQITAEYGCSCVFKRTKNCYPSPVLHAIKKSSDDNHDVTIPTSRHISEEKKEMVYGELNAHVKVQELAERIVELKKQKRGIDKSVQKVESELSQIFDNAGVDCMEVDMGMLTRRKSTSGYEWVIEI